MVWGMGKAAGHQGKTEAEVEWVFRSVARQEEDNKSRWRRWRIVRD